MVAVVLPFFVQLGGAIERFFIYDLQLICQLITVTLWIFLFLFFSFAACSLIFFFSLLFYLPIFSSFSSIFYALACVQNTFLLPSGGVLNNRLLQNEDDVIARRFFTSFLGSFWACKLVLEITHRITFCGQFSNSSSLSLSSLATEGFNALVSKLMKFSFSFSFNCKFSPCLELECDNKQHQATKVK